MWDKEINEIFKQLGTNEKGLTQKEVQNRLQQNGKNEIPKGKSETITQIILQQSKSPIVVILMVAAIFSVLTKSYADAIFILAVILINTLIGTYQEWNSKKNSEKLASLIKINAKVVREGKEQEIASEDMVVGDIVKLESGDKVPADLRLIQAAELAIDESILTGESMPKEKDERLNDTNTSIADRSNIAYAGSIVTKGRGTGVVVAVAKNTEFGKIADKVIASQEEKSPLLIRMERFIKQISIGFILLASILSLFLWIKGYDIPSIFSTVVALTVSAIPEGLTIAMTIILSIASTKMAKKNVIVKKLNAVESLGSCTRIATDKTGTLTANQQTAKKIVLPNGEVAYVKGIGYNDRGEVEFDTNVSTDTVEQIKEIGMLGVLNNEAYLHFEQQEWVYHGDAIDVAFLALGYKLAIHQSNNIKKRIPYESKQRYSAVYYEQLGEAQASQECITVKGAVEKILEFSNTMLIQGKKQTIDKQAIIKQADELAEQGFRVIALAKGIAEPNEDEIQNLTFMGMVGFVDPVREDVIEAIQQCKKAGIKVSMLTGDHSLTANAIAKRLAIEDVHARVTPIEKLEIVEKFKKEGDFIAVTGDGVNDTPALKAANIGIAMGSGTDIAKETGNMIITDDNFSSIVKGIEEGRRAYNNIRKVIYLLLSTGFSEIIVFVFSIFLGLPIPLIAIQLLWLNLISNGIQGDALAFEKDTEDVMNKKVKKKEEKIVNKLLVNEILISSFTMAVIELVVFIYLIQVKNYDIILVRSLLLTLMVFMENVHIFNCRSETISAFKIPLKNNKLLLFSIIITSIIQVVIVSSEPIARFFQLTTLTYLQIGILLILTLPIILVMDFVKRLRNRKVA